jgi:hypothetical protein
MNFLGWAMGMHIEKLSPNFKLENRWRLLPVFRENNLLSLEFRVYFFKLRKRWRLPVSGIPKASFLASFSIAIAITSSAMVLVGV